MINSLILITNNYVLRHLVSSLTIGWVPDCGAVGPGSNPGQTNTQGL